MTCPFYPNPISIQDIINEFGRNQYQTSLAEFYGNGSRVRRGTVGYPGGGGAVQIPWGPAPEQISLGNFHGATNLQLLQIYGSQIWTVPAGVFNPLVLLIGGGGGGGGIMNANYSYGAGGGGGGGIWFGRVNVSPGQQINIVIGGGGAGASGYPNGRGGNGGDSWFGGIQARGGGGGGGAQLGTEIETIPGYWQTSGKDSSTWVPESTGPVTRVRGNGADGGSGGGACGAFEYTSVPGAGTQGRRGGYPSWIAGTRWNGGGGGFNQEGGNGGPGGCYGGAGVLIDMVLAQFAVGGGGGAGNTFPGDVRIAGGYGGGGVGGSFINWGANGEFGRGGGGGGGGNFLGGNGGQGGCMILMP